MNTEPSVILLKIIAVLALVFLNGFFVAAEFALVKIRETQLDELLAKGNRRAGVVRDVLAHLDRYLSAAQLGITLASLGLGWVGEPVFSALLAPVMDWLKIESPDIRHSIAFLVGFTVITFLHITAGEQAPKWLAIQRPLPTSLWVASPLKWFCQITSPFIWVLNQSSLWLLRRCGIEPASEGELTHSDEELRLLLAASGGHGRASSLGQSIVLNAFDLRRRIARDVMQPRQQIVAFDTQATIAQCLDIAEKTRFSRFPLCEEGDLDRTLGVVHLKDLYAMRLKSRTGADLAVVARKVVYIPETARLEKLLELLLDRKLHFAIVVDEYGGTVGMVTLENVLEELVGEIQDEFDQETPMISRLSEDTWEVLGTLPLHDLEELVGQTIPEEGITTTSGWITHRLGGFPKVGDEVSLASCEFRVLEMDETRVGKLQVRRIPAVPEPGS
jgi:CBS domain containing-hemolysin-like protein